MTLVETAISGTLESSDIMITLSPGKESGIAIDLSSSVIKQFGGQIRREIENTLKDLMGQDPDVELTLETAEPMREVCNILAGAYISAIASALICSVMSM